AEPGRSGAVRSTRGGKLDGQIKMAKSFGLMRPPFDSTRLVICALPDEVAGEIKPAAIPAEAHIAKVLPKPLPPEGPITSTPHPPGSCMPALPAASTPKVLEPMRCQLGVAHGVLDVLVPEPSL